MKRILFLSIILIFTFTMLFSCKSQSNNTSGKLQIIATTTMLKDLANTIGKDLVNVKALMGPGIDPHLYKASAGDVLLLQNADIIIYNGLHLEGKMGELFENLENINKQIIEATNGINESNLINIENNLHDPHIWFDVNLWKYAAKNVLEGLQKADQYNFNKYKENYNNYIKELEELEIYIKNKTNEIPEERRILITAHDAFAYFGKAYGFEVKGLQGISTASEAGTSDVSNLASYIAEKKIKAVFVESSVPKKNIEALQEAVKNKGFEVSIGGELYSDSLGSEGSKAETYIGTFKENINTIVNALK